MDDDVRRITAADRVTRLHPLTRWLLAGASLCWALVAPLAAAAQDHTTGVNITKTCDTIVNQGTPVNCAITLENQDTSHPAEIEALTNQVPFPGGPVSGVSAANCRLGGSRSGVTCVGGTAIGSFPVTLATSDGSGGTGDDFVCCTLQESTAGSVAACGTTTALADEARARGFDAAEPGTCSGGANDGGSCFDDDDCNGGTCVGGGDQFAAVCNNPTGEPGAGTCSSGNPTITMCTIDRDCALTFDQATTNSAFVRQPTCTPTPTNTPTDTPTPSPTDTPTLPPTNTPTLPPTNTPTLPPTNTATVPPTSTPTRTAIPAGTTAICRTGGFYGTHAGTDKRGSQNITQAILDAAANAGTPVTVCGECIRSTSLEDEASALEAICVAPSTNRAAPLQLARQLTVMALNCVVSGFGADCSGDAALGALFSSCNAACLGGNVGDCIDAIDCFNNGGAFDPESDTCEEVEDSCHDEPLCNEDLGLCFESPGPAGSSKACNAATKNDCTIFGGCDADTCQ